MSNYDDDVFSQSDEDLFQENTSVSQNLSDHLKSAHGIDVDISAIDTDIDIDNPDSNIIRAKICIALNEASGHWAQHAHSAAFTRTSQQIADELTNGRYSKVNYYYTIEGKIIQRKVIVELLKAMREVDSKDAKFLRDTFKINTDYVFIDVYINHLMNMMNYFIQHHSRIYLAMAKDLGLIPQDEIANLNEHQDLPFIQRQHARDSIANYVTEDYISDVLSKFSQEKN